MGVFFDDPKCKSIEVKEGELTEFRKNFTNQRLEDKFTETFRTIFHNCENQIDINRCYFLSYQRDELILSAFWILLTSCLAFLVIFSLGKKFWESVVPQGSIRQVGQLGIDFISVCIQDMP